MTNKLEELREKLKENKDDDTIILQEHNEFNKKGYEPTTKKEIAIAIPSGGYVDSALYCHACGADNLHHDMVEIFDCAEDANGIHTTIHHLGITTIDNDLSQNPSARRHGILIHFSCEHCNERTVMTIEQHKGLTFLNTAYERSPFPDYPIKIQSQIKKWVIEHDVDPETEEGQVAIKLRWTGVDE